MNDAQSLAAVQAHPKSKSASILLAVFLSYWTWLYTYKRDKGFFWLSIVLIVVFATPIWPLLLWIMQSTSYEIPISGIVAMMWIEIGIIIVTCLWIWALIVTIARPQAWYGEYPLGDTLDHIGMRSSPWKMTSAGILVIVAGVIIILSMVLQPLVYAGFISIYIGRMFSPIQLPSIIFAALAVCSGLYGLLKKSWGTTLTGAIAAIIFGIPSLASPILQIFDEGPRFSIYTTIHIIVFIMGIISLIFVLKTRTSLAQR